MNLKTIHLLIIAVFLILLGYGLAYVLDTDNDFIEDRQKAYEEYRDSLNEVNEGLRSRIEIYELKNDSLRLKNDSIQAKINILDSSLNQLRRKYYEDVANIDHISIDSNIIILSRYLSKEIGN